MPLNSSGVNLPLLSRQLLKYSLIVLLVLLSWLPHFQTYILNFIDQALLQSGILYASSRSVNAVISLLQSAEIGIGVASIQPGQLLDPVNDLAEYMSDAMRLALGSLFIQRVLFTISSSPIFSALFTLAACGYAFCQWRGIYPELKEKILLSFILVRFLVPLIVLSTGLISQVFLDAQIDQQNQQISTTVDELSAQANTTSKQSQQLKQHIKQNKTKVLDQLELLQRKQIDLHQAITAKKIKLNELEQQISAIQATRSLGEKLTFTELEQAKPIIKAQLKEQDLLAGLKKQLNTLNQEKDTLNQQLDNLNKQLNSDGDGQFSQVIKTISQGFQAIIDNVEALFMDFINLLSLLVLKLLLMPLLFLYLFNKGFKVIWQRSIQQVIKELTNQVGKTNDKSTAH